MTAGYVLNRRSSRWVEELQGATKIQKAQRAGAVNLGQLASKARRPLGKVTFLREHVSQRPFAQFNELLMVLWAYYVCDSFETTLKTS